MIPIPLPSQLYLTVQCSYLRSMAECTSKWCTPKPRSIFRTIHNATPLYVMLPNLVAEALNLDPKQTYQVLKCIYGLPDAGHAYYDAYSEHLTQHTEPPSVRGHSYCRRRIQGDGGETI